MTWGGSGQGSGVEEGGEGAGWGGGGGGGGDAGLECEAAGLDGHAEGTSHGHGAGGDGDGGVDEDCVGAEFHGLGRVAWGSDAGVDDDRHDGLLDDNAELVAGLEALMGADGGAEGHDGGRADLLEASCEDGVGVDVGKDGESLADETFGGGEGFDGIWEEVARVRVDLELDPSWQAGGGREASEAHGLVGIHGAAGVG